MARLRRYTDEPSTPPVPEATSYTRTVIDVNDEQSEVIQTKAEYVRMVTYVGQYPAGSVLPASHFEQIDRLLGLGAVVYEPNATQPSIIIPGGASDNTDSTSSAFLAGPPRTPWMAVTPEEVLGHMAMLGGPKGQTWIANQTSRVVPNTVETPDPATNTADHSVADDVTVTL